MSNARDTGTSPFTPEQKQRAEAVACAVAALNQVQHDECVAAFEVVELADYIHTGQLGPHHTPPPVDAEIVGNAPEPEAGDASETVEVTECQWPGCWTEAQRAPRALMLRYVATNYDHLQPACALHAGRSLTTA